MTITRGAPSKASLVSGRSRWHRSCDRKVQENMIFLQMLISFLVCNVAFSGVMAFQTPSPQNLGGNQNHPGRPNTFEPRTTEFPKTSTPADGEDRENGMFSPMDRNHETKRRQNRNVVKSIWETSAPVLVEASSLHTVDFEEPSVERVQVLLKKADMDPVSGKRRTTREPLIARVDLWHGPDSTPQNLAIYLEDEEEEDFPHHDEDDEGHLHGETQRVSNTCDTPFSTIIETPQGHNTIAIRNIAETSDLLACVEGEENENWYKPSSKPSNDSPLQSVIERLKATITPQRIDSTTARKSETSDEESNKAVVGSCTVELPSKVASVQVLLQTDFMQPIQSRIELELRMTDDSSSSPGYRVVKRTIVEVYSEDGMHRPFFAVLETPRKNNKKSRLRRHKGKRGASEQGWFGNNKASYSTSMKVVNLSTTEFPLFATVEPHAIDDSFEENEHDENEYDDNETVSSASSQSLDSEVDDNSHEWTHFGGGSLYDVNSNSTILDAEIL